MWNEVLAKNREQKTGHCVFGPSQMERIIQCPASVQESLKYPPQQASVYAQEGTYLHEVTEYGLKSGVENILTKYPSLIDDHENYQAVRTAIEYFNMVLATCSRNVTIDYEVVGNLASFGLPDVWGTADVAIRDWENSIAHIIDWKFGKGILVNATDNPQLKCYAGIALGYPNYMTKVRLHICQPKREHTSTFDIKYPDLRDWIFEDLTNIIKKAVSSDPPFNPSVEACRWCQAKNNCPARHADTQEKAQMVFAKVAQKHTLTNKDWVELYDLLVELDSVKKEVYQYIVQELEAGHEVPGKKLVAGRSLRKWKDEAAAADYLQSLGLQNDKLYTQKMISPAAAEKLNRKLKGDQDFLQLVDKPPGKPTVVDEDDKRPAITKEI